MIRIVSPGPKGTLRDEYGNCEPPPEGWDFLPAGDAGLTRKVTNHGDYWKVEIRKGRRTTSKGVWAPAEIITNAKNEVSETRSTTAYKKRKEYSEEYRDRKQREYKIRFHSEVRMFLSFSPQYEDKEKQMASLVTAHAIPVGSGTVARTTLIPVEERASRAVIAWMRHHTTVYDTMHIPHIKGKRRDVRRQLAQHSQKLLRAYRKGDAVSENCPLKKALATDAAPPL